MSADEFDGLPQMADDTVDRIGHLFAIKRRADAKRTAWFDGRISAYSRLRDWQRKQERSATRAA